MFPGVAHSSTTKQGANSRHILRRGRAISAGSYSVSLQLRSLASPSRFAQTSHSHHQTYITRLAFQHPSEAKLATVPEQPKAAAGSLNSASVCRTRWPVRGPENNRIRATEQHGGGLAVLEQVCMLPGSSPQQQMTSSLFCVFTSIMLAEILTGPLC